MIYFKENILTEEIMFKKLKKILREILKKRPAFTGRIQLNFYEGNLASISKSEKIK